MMENVVIGNIENEVLFEVVCLVKKALWNFTEFVDFTV